MLNTDATEYGGSGVGNFGAVRAEAKPWHGRPASAVLTVPPLAALWLVHDKSDDKSDGQTPPRPASVIAKAQTQGGERRRWTRDCKRRHLSTNRSRPTPRSR